MASVFSATRAVRGDNSRVPENHATSYAPVATQDRLFTLDVLRGAALLGILLMNIVNFGLPSAAYQNPDLWGGNDAPNLAAFAIHWIFFQGKMRGLFSVMFGAGMVIFMERAAARDNSVRAADLYCRRMLWLMAFGIVHSWLIWSGDILYSYALCGLLLFPLRNLSPKALFVTGGAALLAWQVFVSANGFLLLSTRNAAVAARAEEAAGHTLTKEQQEARKAWDETYNGFWPSKEKIEEEINDYRGGYIKASRQRIKAVRPLVDMPAYLPLYGDVWGMMLIGMGLYKLGVLQGTRSRPFYLRMALIGYGIGVPLNAFTTYAMISSHYEIITIYMANMPHQLGRASVALGHAAVLLLLAREIRWRWLTNPLAAVGQTALSNYIATSIICALIFFTPGLGLIGQLQRYQLYFVVAGVWIFNLAWSPWWLRSYFFGPLEWCWRSLTYWRPQPMRRSAAVQVVATS